jgi:hypothetical protein
MSVLPDLPTEKEYNRLQIRVQDLEEYERRACCGYHRDWKRFFTSFTVCGWLCCPCLLSCYLCGVVGNITGVFCCMCCPPKRYALGLYDSFCFQNCCPMPACLEEFARERTVSSPLEDRPFFEDYEGEYDDSCGTVLNRCCCQVALTCRPRTLAEEMWCHPNNVDTFTVGTERWREVRETRRRLPELRAQIRAYEGRQAGTTGLLTKPTPPADSDVRDPTTELSPPCQVVSADGL